MEDEKLKAFLRWGLHRITCSYYTLVPEGPKKGRRLYDYRETPAIGSPDCLCKDMIIKYNGEPI